MGWLKFFLWCGLLAVMSEPTKENLDAARFFAFAALVASYRAKAPPARSSANTETPPAAAAVGE